MLTVIVISVFYILFLNTGYMSVDSLFLEQYSEKNVFLVSSAF